ncbi:MAG TPA: hypothetical protein VFT22_30720 [Kofleriaceae bacterium]|nr:hypothetical protein [Kofleriaceae bacterium]
MATAAELARVFAAAWTGQAAVGDDVADRLVALCAPARTELDGTLDGTRDGGAEGAADAIDERELVTALAARAPERDVLGYLERCHPGELALAQAARAVTRAAARTSGGSTHAASASSPIRARHSRSTSPRAAAAAMSAARCSPARS